MFCPQEYLFRLIQYPIGYIIDQTVHVLGLTKYCFTGNKFRTINTPFSIYSTYEKEILDNLPLNSLALG